jgi:sn-glycerol 3-phosphate transport system ATP-binding protein/multiple sugar transport system ATP-binding protein
LVARLAGLRALVPGDSLELAFDPAALYLFDAGSQQRIRTARPVAVAEPC